LNNPKLVNNYRGRISSINPYISDGKLFKKLVCKSVICHAHNNRFRELKLQSINKDVIKSGKIISYEYQYNNVKDNNNKIVAISPLKLDPLTYVEPEPKEEPTLEEALSQPD
jgi:hypothetical protein